MPRKRFMNLAPEARSALLGLATKEFAERGFDDASLNGILAQAGISKGVYYYYFEDKEDLFATALEHALDEALQRFTLPRFEGLTRRQFWPAVQRCVGEWTALFDSSSELLRATRFVTAAQRRSPRFAALLERGQVLWRTLIEAGQRLGCVRTDLPVEVLIQLVAAADHTLDTSFFAATAKPTRRSFARHVALVFDTLERLLAKRR